MLTRSLSFLLLCLSFLACRETHVKEIKQFRIYVDTDNPRLEYTVRTLVDDYNAHLGQDILSIVDTSEASTSSIHFRKGLVNDGRKLGLGQWTAIQKQSVRGAFRQSTNTTIEYGMDIVFDLDNFEKKSLQLQDPESDGYKHLFHLFCHEVGHGMQMDHSPDIQSVMYPSITDKASRTVDYTGYFHDIRLYLDDPAALAAKREQDQAHIPQHDNDHSL